MNYYERHLGDYARDTGHLSLLEHGVYTLLLDRYYATESGIPADQAHRICRARTRDEREAVDTVLNEFFSLSDGVYTHGRIEEEIDKARARIDSARENGKRGGRPKKKPVGSESETQQKPNGFPVGSVSETQSKAHQTPDTRLHTPEDQDQDHSSPPLALDGDTNPPADLPSRKAARMGQIAAEAQAAYNRILAKPAGLLTACTVLNKPRMKAVEKSIATAKLLCRAMYGSERVVAQFWDDYFTEAERDDFHAGRGPYRPPHENWRPDFEYLLREDVMAKLFDRAQSADAEDAAA